VYLYTVCFKRVSSHWPYGYIQIDYHFIFRNTRPVTVLAATVVISKLNWQQIAFTLSVMSMTVETQFYSHTRLVGKYTSQHYRAWQHHSLERTYDDSTTVRRFAAKALLHKFVHLSMFALLNSILTNASERKILFKEKTWKYWAYRFKQSYLRMKYFDNWPAKNHKEYFSIFRRPIIEALKLPPFMYS
jgi:hypothetical protein